MAKIAVQQFPSPEITLVTCAHVIKHDKRGIALREYLKDFKGAEAISTLVVMNLRILAQKNGGYIGDMKNAELVKACGVQEYFSGSRESDPNGAAAFRRILYDCGFITDSGHATFDDWELLRQSRTDNELLGHRIRRLREEMRTEELRANGVAISTVAYVADCCDISRTYLSDIELCRRIPEKHIIIKIANYLDVEAQTLLDLAAASRQSFVLAQPTRDTPFATRNSMGRVASRLEAIWPDITEPALAAIDAVISAHEAQSQMRHAALGDMMRKDNNGKLTGPTASITQVPPTPKQPPKKSTQK